MREQGSESGVRAPDPEKLKWFKKTAESKMWFVHIMEYYSALKIRKEILTHAAT